MADETRPKTLESAENIIRIESIELETIKPTPDNWVQLRSGDILVSQSGTARFLFRKNYDLGNAECLRLTCDKSASNKIASLEIENIDINSSNFGNLQYALRSPAKSNFSKTIVNSGYQSTHFSKSVRFNILSLLGFGSVGSSIRQTLKENQVCQTTNEIQLEFIVDQESGQLLDVPPRTKSNIISLDGFGVQMIWRRNRSGNLFLIYAVIYNSKLPVETTESLRISADIANLFSFVHARWIQP